MCVCARTLLLWSRNPLQVVYAEEGIARPSEGIRRRFSFAHGTLRGHMLVCRCAALRARVHSRSESQAGEERFAVELASDGGVYYDVRALSKPGCLMAHLAYPVARAQPARFARDSMAAMSQHVAGVRA